jgi:hypothetical protein
MKCHIKIAIVAAAIAVSAVEGADKTQPILPSHL